MNATTTPHQDMLNEHLKNKEARLDRRDRGHHRLYKKDTEELGFKPRMLPQASGSGFMAVSSPEQRVRAINEAKKAKRGIYAMS